MFLYCAVHQCCPRFGHTQAMSPKNIVPCLSLLCLKAIFKQLIHLLSDDEGKHYEEVSKYLTDATHDILQDLLKVILGSERLDAATRFACLEVILRRDVRTLDTGMFPYFYNEQILEVIRTKGLGLHHLNLKGVWVGDIAEQLSETIYQLKNLKSLTVPHMADDSVIEAALSCTQLAALDISGESPFTASALSKMKSDRITVLDIGSYGKTSICSQAGEKSFEIVGELIENLPNLSVLRTYSYTGKALHGLYEKNPNIRTKLKHIHDTDTSLEEMEAIACLCPELESIYINSPADYVIPELSKLKKLHSLKLSRFNWNELVNYLQTSGDQLQVLKLIKCGETIVDISHICYYAPNVSTLELFKTELTCTDFSCYFMNLQRLEVLYCNINNAVLKHVMTNSPFLKRIFVGDVIYMTDGDVFRLCAECDFCNLVELWFSCAKCLTATSVELLMGHCANLKVIGDLSSWSLSPVEVEFLKAVIEANNIDLNLDGSRFLVADT